MINITETKLRYRKPKKLTAFTRSELYNCDAFSDYDKAKLAEFRRIDGEIQRLAKVSEKLRKTI